MSSHTNLPSTAAYNRVFQVRSIAWFLFVSSFANFSISSETNGSYPKRILVLERLNLQVLLPLGPPFSFSFSLFCCPQFGTRSSVKHYVSLQFLNTRTVGRTLGRGITPSQGRYLHRTTQTQNKRRQISIPWVDSNPRSQSSSERR
jgi:hypothetical protein